MHCRGDTGIRTLEVSIRVIEKKHKELSTIVCIYNPRPRGNHKLAGYSTGLQSRVIVRRMKLT